MHLSSVFRLSAFLGVLGAALSAHGVSLHIESAGGVSYPGVGPAIYDETVTAQVGGFGPLDRYFEGLRYRPDYGDSVLVRGYTGSSGYLAIAFLSGQSADMPGIWAVDTASCLGAWADVVGSGTFTTTFIDMGSPHYGGVTMTLDGTVDHGPNGSDPTPEPASMAALGLGALALVRRRHASSGPRR